MQYLKNVLFVAIFALFGLGLQAATPLYTSSLNQEVISNAPQGDGALEITQGRYGVRVKILVSGLVGLIVRNEAGNVVFHLEVESERRRVNIPTALYPDGTYTLEGIHGEGVEVLRFTLGE